MSKMNALVVDDSRTVRSILKGYLSEAGFNVFEAANGRQGLEVLEAMDSAEIALIDWNMPEMNGLELVKAIRSQDRFRDLPLMMVTTETEMERMSLAFIAGVNEYLMKPFDKPSVLEKLAILGVGI
jgi:two-component system chemotaxis response regulator CheY